MISHSHGFNKLDLVKWGFGGRKEGGVDPFKLVTKTVLAIQHIGYRIWFTSLSPKSLQGLNQLKALSSA